MSSLIRATNLWGYGELVHEIGGDPAALLNRFHIPVGIEEQEDAFISFEALVRLLEASAEELECPDFSMRLSRWQGLEILGPIALIARNAQTVRDGLGAVARYLYVHSPALVLAAAPSPDATRLRFIFEVTEMSLPRLHQAYELAMANGARIVRLLGGAGANPATVSFLHGQLGPDASYAEALGCPVRFDQDWCGFEVPVALADQPIDSADPQTARIATRYLEAEYVPSGVSLSDRVADLARRLLPTGACTAEVIAEQLAMHPRTLQRRLAEESARCQDVIDDTRRRQAAAYLAQPGLQLHQIAGLLGYSEQSTLNRSCRRWFGTTPRQYRRDLG
ncbi:MAG: putative AraC family transcriptional regulator [Marmoricola sp.]|nr:putative AraC family transcriptional regulator [Marmoricola sp.]